ncbi:hypothetical protein ASPVEDRAFT_263853 [Aspergillus versicolor CBS 583.65]|uniref:SRR1-like domain-containing protein n=1 Tax=Aspergillus versicolor CBS 583.65 TaxID=1036611 RepID=A0A1L9P639_ASPVE|nr:uncharacterized protein ASPVEDRAFT_263853 [Aspergillus versicolor CBS 583.65]OJI96978.1 hypothetical protein ASPVEDRAFT_263853 [Aspergillus versicolor CBS 583.65]
MSMGSCLDRPRRDGQDADEWKPSTAEEAAANIDEWYNAGRLLFPRDNLQSIHDQLQKPLKSGDLIYVRAFDGSMYEYPVRIGEKQGTYVFDDEDFDEDGLARATERKKIDTVLGVPHIYYTSYESLKQGLEWSLSRAYCPIGIAHFMERAGQEVVTVSEVEVEAELKSFRDITSKWEDGDTWRGIKSTLLSLDLCCKIPKVIGMACGRFTATSGYDWYERSAVQHALLILLKRMLEESGLGTEQVACYAQDPVYSPADQAVMKELGIQEVNDPEGFLQMDDSSLVFCCSPNICVKQIMADMARPSIIIWCSVREDDPKYSSYGALSLILD